MSEESATLRAIRVTRVVLERALSNSRLLIYMAANDVAPGDVEDVVYEVLEYLDKTEEEKKPCKPEKGIIPGALRLLDDWEKAGLGDYVVNGRYVNALRARLEGSKPE